MPSIKTILLIVGVIFLVLLILSYFQARFSQQQVPDLGTDDQGRLSPCPDSPNCVSTQDQRSSHSMPPWRFEGDALQAQSRLKALIEQQPRTRLIAERPGYLHYQFITSPMPYADDVEFVLKGDSGEIHFRSASRLGHSDLGVNRKRMEALAQAWTT